MEPSSKEKESLAAGRVASEPKAVLSITGKWWVLIAIGIGTFMSALDSSVVNTVLPVMAEDYATSVATIQWVVIIYLLIVSGLLLSFGRLGDLRGHRPVYLSGFGIFIASSAMCGLAPTPSSLVIFRGIQALGAAMLSANSPAILTKSFPATQRGQALGLQATMTYMGLTVGPTLGGWLTEQYGWPAVFFINIPVGLVALLLSFRFVPHDRPTERREPYDRVGAGLFMAGLVALLLGLNQAHNWGWTSVPVLSLLAAALVLLSIFVRYELRTRFPMLDLSLFSSRIFSSSVFSAVLNYICVYSITFLMPFYLIQGRGLGPSQAGLILSAMPVVMAVVAPISGTLSDRIGVRLPSTLGMIALSAGLVLLSTLGPGEATLQIVLSLALAGLGIGVFISPNNSALMGAAPRHRQGIAAGILATARSVGMVLGVGLAGAVFTTVLSHRPAGAGGALFQATQAAFLLAAALAGVGAVTSAVRGRPENKESK